MSPNSATFDGNGNVITYVDMATGVKSATYEYGAFGETLIADGVAAELFPFKFSTRYTDSETGIIAFPLRPYSPSNGRFLCKDPIEEDGGANLYGFVGNDGINGIDPLGLIGPPVAVMGRPNAAAVERVRQWAFALIVDQGQVGAGLPQNLLRQWLWKRGDYRLSDAEFNEHVWGDKNYRVLRSGANTATTNFLSLSMSSEFSSDLNSKCSSGGETFTGTYRIEDYANTPRTLGHFFWYVEVTVKCGCCKGGYEATGTVHVQDPYDFNAMNRANAQDEADVGTMRQFHNITGMGKDFTITSSNYSVTETSSCDSGPMGKPYLKRR